MLNGKIIQIMRQLLHMNPPISDIHITTKNNIFYRQEKILKPLTPSYHPSQLEITQFLHYLLPNSSWSESTKWKLDSHIILFNQPMRLHLYICSGALCLSLRIINRIISQLSPQLLHIYPQIFAKPGLILITGPANSGKSTTMARLLQHHLNEQSIHLITLEDPIEYIFHSPNSLIHQRSYKKDFFSFAEALKEALREDPDIIMLGEIRDSETMATALMVAETGHFVFATLHTADTINTLLRIESFFPRQELHALRQKISMLLRSIISQQLLLDTAQRLVCAREILFNIPAIANLISQGKYQHIYTHLQMNTAIGMQTMAISLSKIRERINASL